MAGRERIMAELAERFAPPQQQCAREQSAGAVGVAGVERGPGRGQRRFEAGGVDLLIGGPQQVAGRAGDQDRRWPAGGAVGLEHSPQVGDVRLQRSRGPGRRLVGPQLGDEGVERHDPIGVEEQQGQQGALLAAAEIDRGTTLDHFDRAQNPVFHGPLPLPVQRQS